MTDLRKVAAAMGGEVRGNVASFPTPGHSKGDRGSWAKIAPGAPDGLLVHSANGGDPLAIKEILREKQVLPPRQTLAGNWRVTGTYEFADEAGTVLYRTRRHECSGKPKRYTVERPDGRGGWIDKIGDAPRVLYRLPEILAADPAEPVYLVEGERKADKLAGWGLAATAIAFGANGWRKAYAEPLAGRTVIILPDNDVAGHTFAEKASAGIVAAGGKPIIVELPGLPPKGDIMDWPGSADDLRALTFAGLSAPVPVADTIPLLDPAAWAGVETPAREWALYEMILVGQVTYLTGAGSAGKSLMGQQLATCIAVGIPFLGLDVRQGVALYLTCEDDEDELHRRQKAICAALGVPLSALSGKLHLASLMGKIGNELATFDALGRMATSPAWERLRATVLACRASFIVLDNVAHLFAGNENIRSQVAAFLSLLNGLAAETGAAILLLGHPNKAGADYSGSTAWENQVRSRLFLTIPSDDDGAAPDPDARILSRGKANYARNGEALSFRWHKWAFVRHEDLPPNVAAEIAANVQASADDEIFLRCLDERNRQERPVSESKASRTYAPKEFAEMAESKRIGRTRLEAAMDRLFRITAIERGVVGRYRGEGKNMIGLRRTSDDIRGNSDDLSDDLPMTPSDDVPMTTRRPPKAHTPIPTVYSGAAPEGAAAPFHEEEDEPAHTPRLAAHSSRRQHGPILAPDDIADGGTGGLAYFLKDAHHDDA